MTYKINKTDGSLLVEVIDSAIDTTATDIALIGKNVTGYGEYLNENFIKLLENFASTSEPNNPITGQLWFDVSENRLKVYDGNGFRIGSGPIVSGTAPLSPIQGDFWIDSEENQLYFYDGTDRVLAGPIYKNSQGISGFEVDNITDVDGNLRTIVKLWAAQTLIGIFSKYTEFTPASLISGFSGTIKTGFNAGTLDGLKFNVTASAADALVDSLGVLKPADSFMVTDDDNVTTGSISIASPTTPQLTLGAGGEIDFSVDPAAGGFVIASNENGLDIDIQTRTGSTTESAIKIVSDTKRVGVFNSGPTATLHVGTVAAPGSVIIEGDLTVNGATTTLNTATLTVEDKNIIMASGVVSDGVGNNGAGITIKGTTDKTLQWLTATSAWTSSEHINIASSKEYRIAGQKVLDATGLGSSIASSSLTSVGTLTNLTVSGNITTNEIRTASGNLTLNPAGFGVVDASTSRITNVITPPNYDVGDPAYNTYKNDAATKEYVDTKLPANWSYVDFAYYESETNQRLLIDTNAGDVNVVLPYPATSGDTVRFIDYAGTFNLFNLTIARYRSVVVASPNGVAAASGTFVNLPTIAVTGTGVGLIVTVAVSATGTYIPSTTTITITNHGFGYVDTDQVKILGSVLLAAGMTGAVDVTNDLLIDIGLADNILQADNDLTINDSDAAFGLIFTNNTWKFTEVQYLPAVVNADLIGDVTGNLTGNVLGNLTGDVTGTVLTAAQPNITSVGTLTSLTVSGTINGNQTGNSRGNLVSTYDASTIIDTSAAIAVLTGNVTGNVTGNISNSALAVSGTSSLTLSSGSSSILIRSGNSGLRLSAFDNTGTQEQYAVQVTPGASTGQPSSTILFGNVIVSNVTTSNINGASFRLPTYTAVELAARTLTFLNYGELIYNSTAKKTQAYVEDGAGVGVAGWVDLH